MSKLWPKGRIDYIVTKKEYSLKIFIIEKKYGKKERAKTLSPFPVLLLKSHNTWLTCTMGRCEKCSFALTIHLPR